MPHALLENKNLTTPGSNPCLQSHPKFFLPSISWLDEKIDVTVYVFVHPLGEYIETAVAAP